MNLSDILAPPLDAERVLAEIPELALARGVEQSPYHHLDTLDHIFEVARRVEAELEEAEIGAEVYPEYLEGLRLVALLHDVAKPVTRGKYEGKTIFVAHDTLGAMMARGICARLSASALATDVTTALTALHLKIGFMDSERTDFPPERLVPAAAPFGEELAVLSWADRLAAQGPRLRDEHIERHKSLCEKFLELSRDSGSHPTPDYEEVKRILPTNAPDSDAGFAAARARLLASRGLDRERALRVVVRTL